MAERWDAHLQQNRDFSQSSLNCGVNRIEECPGLARMLIIFDYLQSLTGRMNVYRNLFAVFNRFTITDLLNDIDHIMIFHDKQISKGLFENKIGVCHSNTCQLYSRRYTKRNLSDDELHDESIDTEFIVKMSILEQAHSYLFHSIPNKDTTKIWNWKQYNKSHPERKFRYDMNEGNGIFISNQNDNIDDDFICYESKQDESFSNSDKINCNKDESKHNVTSPFSTGHRFEYAQFDRNGKKSKFYCGCKWKNLKEELTVDKDKNISLPQFHAIIKLSSKKAETSYSRNLISRKLNNNEVKNMSMQRVFSVILYCNNGQLASALKRTFLKLPGEKRQGWACARKLHIRFGHWAKLLCTTVDYFGTVATFKQKFYRGYKLDDGDRFKFKAFSFHLYGPISTTSVYGVAFSFTEGSGIILQLQKGIRGKFTRYFDCRHYSAFTEEAELLFFGYDNYFNVTKICEGLSLKNGKDTRPVLLLQSLTSKYYNQQYLILTSSGNEDVIRLLNRLLMDQIAGETKSDYLSEIVDNFVSKRKIYIRLNLLMKIQKWVKDCGNRNTTQDLKNLYHFFVNDGDLMHRKNMFEIDMDKIIKLFTKCNQITFNFTGWNHKLCKNNKTWMNLVEFMTKNGKNKSKLRKILLKNISCDKCVGNNVLWDMAFELMPTKWRIYQYERLDDCKSLMFIYGSADSFNHPKNQKWKIISEPTRMKYKRKAKEKLVKIGNKFKNTTTNSNDDDDNDDADNDNDADNNTENDKDDNNTISPRKYSRFRPMVIRWKE